MRERKRVMSEHAVPYRAELYFDSDERAWFVRYPELPGCLAHGSTTAAALRNGERAKKLWIETAREHGNQIPTPVRQLESSGKFVLRLPKTLHQEATERAAKEGVSLNTFLVQATAEAVQRSGFRSLIRFFERILPKVLRSALTHAEGAAPSAVRLMVGLEAIYGDDKNPKTEREISDEPTKASRELR